MDYLKILICGILLSFAIFDLLVSIYTYSRHDRSSKYFSFLSISIAIYSLGYAMELYSSSLNHKLIWNLVQYVGLPFIPTFWVLFTFSYINKSLRLRTKLILFIFPIFTVFFRYTSYISRFDYSGVQLLTNKYFSVLDIQKGPWYLVNGFFIAFGFVISNYYYFILFRKSTGIIRRQGQLLLIASLFPWLAFIMDLLNISPFGVDYGPIALTFALLILSIAFFRYRFLNLRPLARDKIFESTSDGIIVLEKNYNIIDNKFKLKIFPEILEETLKHL